MQHDLYWQAIRWLALEHLRIEHSSSGVTADGLIVGSFDDAPLRLRYRIECEAGWQTTKLRVHDLVDCEQVELSCEPNGRWFEANGSERRDLAGALDVDISATPFTNTLPIRRLQLVEGQSADISVVYVIVKPRLALQVSRQRYTRLECAPRGDTYLYESLESEFKRELFVDEYGFVVEYPGIWRRATNPE